MCCLAVGPSCLVLIRGEDIYPSTFWSTFLYFLCLSPLVKSVLFFLRSLLEKIEQETWRETGISFVTSVTRLVERLLDYRYAGVKAEIDNFLTFSPACASLWYSCWHRCCEETPLARRPPWAPWLLSKAINNCENPNLTWRTWSHCYKKAE